MKIIGLILVLGGLTVTMNINPVLAFIYIGIGIFLLRKYKHQGWLPKKSNSDRQQKKELKRLEQSKINELNNRRAYISFSVAGVTHNNRQSLLDTIVRKHSSEGIGMIELIPEPDNKYDPNAIKIIFKDIGHIGYVPKERTADVTKLLEKNVYDLKWNIDYFYDEDDDNDEDINYMEIRLYLQK